MIIQLISFSGSKWPVLPYTSALLEKITKVHLPNIYERCTFLPYIWNTLDGSTEFQLQKIIKHPTIHVFGFSFYIWNINRNIHLASLLKKKYPSAIFIAGGSMIPENDEDLDRFFSEWPKLKELFQIFVRGEGEQQWIDIVSRIDSGNTNFDDINNIFWIKDSKIQINNSFRVKSLIEAGAYIDNPNIDECIDFLKTNNLPIRVVWETNRGCPYSCAFCAWGTYTKQKVKTYSDDLIDQEIRWLCNNVNTINIADANFGILPKDVDIAKKFVEYNKNGKLTEIIFAGAKNNKDRVLEVGKVLYQGNLLPMGLLLGIQSTNDKVLKLSKRGNISWNKIVNSTKEIKAEGIPHYYDLIIGLPEETYSTFLDSIEILLSTNPSDVRVFPLILFPNSDFYSTQLRKEYGFKTSMWKISDNDLTYDQEFMEVVYETKTMTSREIKKIKRLSEIIENIHLGKILYYVPTFLKNEYGIRIIDFYSDMFDYFENKIGTEIYKFITQEYYKIYNGGEASYFKGDFLPFGITPRPDQFRKQTLLWLCIMYNQDKLLNEITDFLTYTYPNLDAVQILDLLSFQKNIVINFKYDPNSPKEWNTTYNWWEYFNFQADLQKVDKVYSVHDKTINGKKIIGSNPNSYMNIAGDCSLYPNKDWLYEHKVVESK